MRIPSGRPAAIARMGGEGPAAGLSGYVRFYQMRDGVLVTADISGLPKDSETGIFAFHIHEGGACTGAGYADTGGHYNPAHTQHPRHAGDLPPLFACRGRASMAVLTDRFRVAEIIGRTVVIHSDPDDFHTQPSGNAGSKIACGVIRGV